MTVAVVADQWMRITTPQAQRSTRNQDTKVQGVGHLCEGKLPSKKLEVASSLCLLLRPAFLTVPHHQPEKVFAFDLCHTFHSGMGTPGSFACGIAFRPPKRDVLSPSARLSFGGVPSFCGFHQLQHFCRWRKGNIAKTTSEKHISPGQSFSYTAS